MDLVAFDVSLVSAKYNVIIFEYANVKFRRRRKKKLLERHLVGIERTLPKAIKNRVYTVNCCCFCPIFAGGVGCVDDHDHVVSHQSPH